MVLALSFCLVLAGCGGSGTGDDGTGTGGDDLTEGLVLVEDGKPTFQFVISYDAPTAAKNKANEMIKKVNKVMSKDAKQVNENYENETEIEIIIGAPKFRGDECAIDQHYLGPEGYAVKVVGSKILVLYGSEAAATSAINFVEETLFGISSKTKTITSVVATKDKLIENKQQFTLQTATVAGNNINDYVLEYPTSLREQAQAIQNQLYNTVGIWLPKGNASANQKAVIIREISHGSENSTEKGFIIYVDENQNLVIETEFPNKFEVGVKEFLDATILQGGKKEMHYAQNYVFDTYDARNIYYKDYGAKGDGRTDDFEAIKKCHEEANQYGHTVNATPGATYKIGQNTQGTAAIIQTDTNWNGCKFLIDDSKIEPKDPGYGSALFYVKSSAYEKTYNPQNEILPFTSLDKSATNIGWAPGFDCLIYLTNSTVKHFIRYGGNADNGASQTELILVDKDGNIDPSTPLQWTYETITSIKVKGIDDAPIIINGGEFDLEAGIDNRADFTTIYNQAPSAYTYYERNIQIKRSNVILKNLTHVWIDALDHGAPYNGFTSVSYCNNVVIDGCEFDNPPSFSTTGSGGTEVSMGSYEMTAGNANNITWQNCTQSDFYNEDGSVTFHGMMGTNYCKNLKFDNMFVCSFDAHKGTYNATILNSTVEHLNFIGEGTIHIENTKIYTDGSQTIANLRNDYGSTWQGKIIVKNVKLMYHTSHATNQTISVTQAKWVDHYFGYQTYLPEYYELDNVSLVEYEFGFDDKTGERWEKVVSVNKKGKSLYIIPPELTNTIGDITPTGKNGGDNPYIGPGCLNIINCGDLNVFYKDTCMFKNMWVYKDGELIRSAPSGIEFVPTPRYYN